MVFSDVIVDVTISCRSFVFSQSRAKASAGFRQTGRQDRQGAVYKNKCCDCRATYIGEISAIENLQRT